MGKEKDEVKEGEGKEEKDTKIGLLDNYCVKESAHKSSWFRREGNLKKVSRFLTYVTIRGSLG